MSRLASFLSVGVLAAGLLLATPAPAVAAGDADAVVALVNAERATAGLQPLRNDPGLAAVAAEWAAYVNQNPQGGTFHHSTSEWRNARIVPLGWPSGSGENIAWGYTSASSVMTAWMGSSGHRANILGSQYGGIGVARVGNSWVQVFALAASAMSPGAVPTISGTGQLGIPLNASTSGWPSGATLNWRWLRNGSPIPGATGASYIPSLADAGKTLKVELRVKRSGYMPEVRVSAGIAAPAWAVDVSRVAGADRFDVGVNASKALYPSGGVPAAGVPVVYIANGYNFPDALTASPAAALHDGAVLLVGPDAIPAAVASELTRLRPQRIVVAGGPASVSPAVFAQLASFVASPADVVRAGGADRYEASRTIVRDAFGDVGASIAIIATGANFPDALSAGPAAATQNAPVILVYGGASSIDAATKALLIELGVERVYIAGGTGSVSPGIASSLAALVGSGNVVRFAGADRFEVAVMIADEFFSTSDRAYIATGFTFPDALTGGPLAASTRSPLYLSGPDCLPKAIAYDLVDLDTHHVVLLGGPGSLGPAVQNLQFCG